MRACFRGRVVACSLTLVSALGFGCNVDPDIVARATDSGVGLNDDDAGGQPTCETDSRLTPVSSSPNCEIQIPRPFPPNFDPNRINVNVFQDDMVLPFAGGLNSLSDCDHVAQGWYWIDPSEYTRIGFCPPTCKLIAQWESIALQFGCLTIRPPWFLQPPQPEPQP